MKPDIVDRLRQRPGEDDEASIVTCDLMEDAADEIEKLRLKLKNVAKHPDATELLRQYADGELP